MNPSTPPAPQDTTPTVFKIRCKSKSQKERSIKSSILLRPLNTRKPLCAAGVQILYRGEKESHKSRFDDCNFLDCCEAEKGISARFSTFGTFEQDSMYICIPSSVVQITNSVPPSLSWTSPSTEDCTGKSMRLGASSVPTENHVRRLEIPTITRLFGVHSDPNTCRRTVLDEGGILPIFSTCAKTRRLRFLKIQAPLFLSMNTSSCAHLTRGQHCSALRESSCPRSALRESSRPRSKPKEDAKARWDPGKTGRAASGHEGSHADRCGACSAHTSCKRTSSSTRSVPGVEKKSVLSVITILPGNPGVNRPP